MATSKTLAPTNVTISIPAMTDAPDASVFSNCVDKEADAINALNSQIAYYTDAQVTISSADLINVDLPSLSGRKILAVSFIYNNDYYYAIIDDNRQLYVSLRDTNNTITVLQKGGTRTTDRTVTVRVHYAVV